MDETSSQDMDLRTATLLDRRQDLTASLTASPYDLILYLQRAVVYSNLGYPDLAAGDAYRALLLTDEVLDESFEYHEQASESLEVYLHGPLPEVLRFGALECENGSGREGNDDNDKNDKHDIDGVDDGNDTVATAAAATPAAPATHMASGDVVVNGAAATAAAKAKPTTNGSISPSPRQMSSPSELAALASTRCFQILSLSLLLCGCLRSAHRFCERGLASAPGNKELLNVREYIGTVARRRFRRAAFRVEDLPDSGVVRREVYPWNVHEPDRFSAESLAHLNGRLQREGVAPKCEVRRSDLPVLLEGASSTDGYDIIPTCPQLGIFAREDIAPGEVVLREYSALTASNRLREPACDACGEELPRLGSGGGGEEAAPCPECADAVFCSEACLAAARELYHPAVCDKGVDSIAREPETAEDVPYSLYLLLLARLLAMSSHQDLHPLEVEEVKYIWGDFMSPASNEIDLNPGAGPPPVWTLPFSFRFSVEYPLHVLERMDVDIYATLGRHDLWVINTLQAKFRATASARKSARDGRPDVAAVHPLWCLANHDCDPNVAWEWGGRMELRAREVRVVGGGPGGLRKGEEVLNHYCDVGLPVQLRREWARGSLGGWCMCSRCRSEAAAEAAAAAEGK